MLPLQTSQHHFSLRLGYFGTPKSSRAALSPTARGSSPQPTQPPHSTSAAGEPGRGRWQQSLFLAEAGMRQPGPRSGTIQPRGPQHRAGIYRLSHPPLYPQTEFSTTAPFPQGSLLQCDSEVRTDLNFSPVRTCQAHPPGRHLRTPPRVAPRLPPLAPAAGQPWAPRQQPSCHLQFQLLRGQSLSFRGTHGVPLQTTSPAGRCPTPLPRYVSSPPSPALCQIFQAPAVDQHIIEQIEQSLGNRFPPKIPPWRSPMVSLTPWVPHPWGR